MGNKKATGFLCLRLVPCFAYVGAEDNRKGIPFVKIVSLLCKLIQFLMVALSVTVHKALILLVFLNHPYQSLAFMGNLGHSIVRQKNDRVYIEKGNKISLGNVSYFTFEPHISVQGSKYGYKRENIYYFDKGVIKEL